MKILHISSGDFFSTYGGGQIYVKNVVDCMIDMNLDVAVVSSVAKSTFLTVNRYRNHQIVEIPTSTDEATLRKAIQSCKPDIIHAHSLKALACGIGQSLNIPVVVTSHHGGIFCPAGVRLNYKDVICHSKVNHQKCLPCMLRITRTGLRCWYPFMRLLSRKTYLRIGKILRQRRYIQLITPIGMAAQYIEGRIQEWNEIAAKCSRMIAPCNEIADAMIQNGLDAGKVHILPHGIPLPDHRPDYPAVINGRVKFYYVGRIDYTKGIHILLEAFSKVNDEKIELHLIGGTAYKQEKQYMQTLQEKYRKDPRIVWHGKVAPEAVYEMTKDFHVSCAASICLESFGLNIAEALVLGKPVLASRCGGGEMQIEDGVNGWLVPANDVSALAEKIRYIANHTEILPRLSANCRAISIQDHCKQLLEIYQDCQNHG